MTSNLYKEASILFLQMVVSGKIREAFERHISSDFRHHNPYFRGDAESLMLAMEENAVQSPNKTLEVKHAIVEENTVAVHSHIKQYPEDIGAAVVHIFRFEEEKIVELWDVGQAIPEELPNEHGMF
ncbi:nuclear transport factor 2 family protein [Bacillus sp. CHD6a]|uniref:nuclear transport factor 2 family protein n=1 Tax=Bacillus sp. CHD6a TaxID=1643452 RepID=UPI0006CD9DEC|nr:nuclear transport factor 2 family protein [Bacillus sp. CHD6a]KPB05703.1 polyketide cyclase [Bacillus sp. CHD6a]